MERALTPMRPSPNATKASEHGREERKSFGRLSTWAAHTPHLKGGWDHRLALATGGGHYALVYSARCGAPGSRSNRGQRFALRQTGDQDPCLGSSLV